LRLVQFDFEKISPNFPTSAFSSKIDFSKKQFSNYNFRLFITNNFQLDKN
jgi:hypothetical protein